ncbi:MAG: hypothetical protein FJZ93_09710 [Chloroflexi bacterium]|nr:hypothetical protein [Chloroflexota bacterium]
MCYVPSVIGDEMCASRDTKVERNEYKAPCRQIKGRLTTNILAIVIIGLFVSALTMLSSQIWASPGNAIADDAIGGDDGVADAYLSSCRGYRVFFHSANPIVIRGVAVYGYGVDVPYLSFCTIEIIDAKGMAVYSGRHELSGFTAEPSWHRFDTYSPVKVAGDFSVLLHTKHCLLPFQRLESYRGIFVGADSSAKLSYSHILGAYNDSGKQISSPVNLNYMIRVIGTAADQKQAREIVVKTVEQIIDMQSPKEAQLYYNVVARNNDSESALSVTIPIGHPQLDVTVKRVYDRQVNLVFLSDKRQSLSSAGRQVDTIVVYLKEPLKAGGTCQFVVEAHGVAPEDLTAMQAFVPKEMIERETKLAVILPPHYHVYSTKPISAVRSSIGDREAATLLVREDTDLGLTVYVSTQVPESVPVVASLFRKLISPWLKDGISLVLVASGGLGLVVLVSVAVYLAVVRKRKRLSAVREVGRQYYEQKLAQWEKEGYDVDEYKKKWFEKP